MRLAMFIPIYFYTILLLILTTITQANRTILQTTFFQPPSNKTPIILDTFTHPSQNNLGSWHGALEDLPFKKGRDAIHLHPSDPDHTYHTQLSSTQCFDLTPYQAWFLHIIFTGLPTFSVSLHQNNAQCNPGSNPYPETWDSIDASHYTTPSPSNKTQKKDIYIPLSHFHIDQRRVLAISLGSFYPPYNHTLTIHKIEFVPKLPSGIQPPRKIPNGTLRLRCTRPGSFAFGIDDGIPSLANEVKEILDSEGVHVTFFVVGKGLRDSRTGLRRFYRQMLEKGHQVALHSDRHLKMEGMRTTQAIDDDIRSNRKTFRSLLARYFRPPYGTIGSRTRERLAAQIRDPQVINWSVDIEDWMWADSDTPERQLEAFYRDVERGGNLAVLHYLNSTTVGYFREIIRFVRKKGLRIMRIDQCLEDPAAPLLV
ncbi:hypothetical protein BDV28DRAFT_163465 [Aspergillus coremiiformis]|uniref:NodB homology domain-containing protein n=1 Tax=Aspergillus coremiiformis TaxID=138285 RepID=A0A5N6ZDY4_9EURO|nr:hypothetical protein BDV28DRAFT_163465 [Aspergillus coremiiformis]